MSINSIKNEYKKVTYIKQLELYLNECILKNEFNDTELSNYKIVIRQSYSKTDIEYQYIEDIDAIKGYLLECFQHVQTDFKTYNYNDFGYDDIFLFYRKLLFDSKKSDVYLTTNF